MKKLILASIVTLTSTAAIAGDADVNNFSQSIYVGVHGGAAIPSGIQGAYLGQTKQLNTGLDAGAHLGYQTGGLRFEGAFTYLNNGTNLNNSANLQMTTSMINGYCDFNISRVFVPFVGVGAGWEHAWTGNSLFVVNSPDNNEFAYQAMGGLRFHASQHFIVDIDYHYLSWTDGNTAQNLVESGLSYVF